MTPTTDPDLTLPAFAFDIPNLTALRAVMVAERKAVAEVNSEIQRIVRNTQSAMLVDPMGKPIPMAGGSVAEQVKALVHGLLQRPILSLAYAIGTDLIEGSEPTLIQFEPAGTKLAFLTYQGLGMLLMGELGKNMTDQLINSVDMITVFTLQALHNRRNPFRVIEKALQFKAKDAATGAEVLGQPEWADQVRRKLADLMVVFLLSSGYAMADLELEVLRALLFTAGPDLPELGLTEDGERLYLHLRDQVAFKMSLMRRGTEITDAAMAMVPESKTMAEIERDLLNPKTPLHEA